MIPYLAPSTLPENPPAITGQVERTLEVGQMLLHWPACTPQFARQAVEVFLELYRSARAEKDFRLMELACKCLQLGWVSRLSGASPRRFNDRRRQARPYLSQRARPEVSQVFYQAYLGVIADPVYHQLKAEQKTVN